MAFPIRPVLGVLAAALLCACAARSEPSSSPAGAPGSPNALASAAGSPGAVPLDAGQRSELDRTVAARPARDRPHLRYAVALGDDGKPHLVVYDGQGLPADGRHPGKPHEYVVFQVLNTAAGEHYDPQQNAVIAAIPPPVQRDNAVTP